MTRILLCTLLALVTAAGCGKKNKPPEVAIDTPVQKQAEQKVQAPGGVPQEFASLLAEKWPDIQKEGDAFLVRFAEASAARNANDRERLAAAIEAAAEHYRKAKDDWAEIAYWPLNAMDDGKIDQKVADKCERHMKTYSGKVKGWDKKAKGLKELSTVK